MAFEHWGGTSASRSALDQQPLDLGLTPLRPPRQIRSLAVFIDQVRAPSRSALRQMALPAQLPTKISGKRRAARAAWMRFKAACFGEVEIRRRKTRTWRDTRPAIELAVIYLGELGEKLRGGDAILGDQGAEIMEQSLYR